MNIGCFTMDLYCDRDGAPYGEKCQHKPTHYTGGPQAQFTGKTEAECIRQARKKGWAFSTGKSFVLCPGCVKDGAKFVG